MQAVAEKLDELFTLLQNKIVIAEAKESELVRQESLLKDKLHKADVVIEELKRREDLLLHAESAEKVFAEAHKKLEMVNAQATANAKDAELITKQKDQVEKLQAETITLKELYKSKLSYCDNKEKELIEEKKNLRAKILEEIKGKL